MSEDLSFYTEDQLIDELKKRNSGLLLVTVCDTKVGENEARRVTYYGGFCQALGLVQIARLYLETQCRADEGTADDV